MNKNQKKVAEWISNNPFIDAISELDNAMESVPNEVYSAYETLTEKKQLEAIQEALKNHISGMKKYIAIGNSKIDGELWFLVDAKNVEDAKGIVLDAEGEAFELSACVEVTTNDEAGISHKFSLVE